MWHLYTTGSEDSVTTALTGAVSQQCHSLCMIKRSVTAALGYLGHSLVSLCSLAEWVSYFSFLLDVWIGTGCGHQLDPRTCLLLGCSVHSRRLEEHCDVPRRTLLCRDIELSPSDGSLLVTPDEAITPSVADSTNKVSAVTLAPAEDILRQQVCATGTWHRS